MDKPIPPSDVACTLVVTTVGDREAALRLARALVDARLAACVQIVDGLRSIYRWQGAIEDATECQLIAKTPPSRAEALVARLRELHPYEVPEIVTLDGRASAAYGAWLVAETIE
jgi:periplasmic divalent cation tolerance protein